MTDVVIIGGGIAGFTTAQELRRAKFDGPITIVDPSGLPYDRPPLSKEYLNGAMPAEKLVFVDEVWFQTNDVKVVTARATALDPREMAVSLDDGSTLTADEIVLAMGSTPRRLPVPGGDLDGILTLSTREESDALRAQLQPGRHIGIIGAGLVGSEVAATALAAGCRVTLVSSNPLPGAPLWGRDLAERLHSMHTAKGVEVVTAVPHAVERNEKVFLVDLSGGGRLEVDTLLVAIGSDPNVQLAETAGLRIDGGIVVDEQQQTSAAHVHAVGDATRVVRPDGSLAPGHGHWEAAMHAGQRVAAVLTGGTPSVPGASWMWSDRHGVHAEAVGSMDGGELVTRRVDGLPTVSFNLDITGRILGAAAVDGGNAVRAARKAMEKGITAPAAVLADPSVDLRKALSGKA